MGEAALAVTPDEDKPINWFGEAEARAADEERAERSRERRRMEAPKAKPRIDTRKALAELETLSTLDELHKSPHGGCRAAPEWWGMTSPIARCQPQWVYWARRPKPRRMRYRIDTSGSHVQESLRRLVADDGRSLADIAQAAWPSSTRSVARQRLSRALGGKRLTPETAVAVCAALGRDIRELIG